MYYFLPLFFLTLTSGLPPGNLDLPVSSPLRHDASLPPLWAKLSVSNQSESDISGADEPESSGQDVLPIPNPRNEPDPLENDADRDNAELPVKSYIGVNTSPKPETGSLSTSPTSTMEPPPVNAPLVNHNHTSKQIIYISINYCTKISLCLYVY